jgi:hypothetical protein
MVRKAIRWSPWYWQAHLRAKFYIAELKSDEDAGKEEEEGCEASESESSKAKSEAWTLQCRHEVVIWRAR